MRLSNNSREQSYFDTPQSVNERDTSRILLSLDYPQNPMFLPKSLIPSFFNRVISIPKSNSISFGFNSQQCFPRASQTSQCCILFMCQNRMALLTLDVTKENKFSGQERIHTHRFVRLATSNFNFDGNFLTVLIICAASVNLVNNHTNETVLHEMRHKKTLSWYRFRELK